MHSCAVTEPARHGKGMEKAPADSGLDPYRSRLQKARPGGPRGQQSKDRGCWHCLLREGSLCGGNHGETERALVGGHSPPKDAKHEGQDWAYAGGSRGDKMPMDSGRSCHSAAAPAREPSLCPGGGGTVSAVPGRARAAPSPALCSAAPPETPSAPGRERGGAQGPSRGRRAPSRGSRPALTGRGLSRPRL